MTQSMTAFSQVQVQADSVILSWEIRSLNHRYLDISFRLPEAFKHLEGSLRQFIRGKISRGKLECNLKITEVLSERSSSMVDDLRVQTLLQEAKRISTTFALADDLKLSHVLAWPGVVGTTLPVDDNLAEKVEILFQAGLAKLIEGKKEEGMVLGTQLKTRLTKLRHEIVNARQYEGSMLTSARNRLKTRLDELQMNIADTRLEQELALILTRLDVSEELDRLEAHINEVERLVNLEECSGKRLDFLMQELHREANTLGSKSDSVLLSQQVVEIKVLIEQMREQIQNIE